MLATKLAGKVGDSEVSPEVDDSSAATFYVPVRRQDKGLGEQSQHSCGEEEINDIKLLWLQFGGFTTH